MDRLNQLRGEAGTSRDSTLDTSSPPSEAFMTANESSSKYFSLSEEDSTFDISPIKDVPASSATDAERPIADSDRLISNLSPIGKKDKDFLDGYKIGRQIEAANILSGGVEIFDDNDNSYDGDELVIDDDNADSEDKSHLEMKSAESSQFKNDESSTDGVLVEEDAVGSKDTEVTLQIDGKNVDAINIGNGLYLYRKQGQEELAAVQIIDDDQQPSHPSFKFLKVRENAEGNLEVYEEIQIEVPKEVPVKEGKVKVKNISHVPIKDISKVIIDSAPNNVPEEKNKVQTEQSTKEVTDPVQETFKELSTECKTEINVNGKMMKFSESRKSPVVGTFTPMTYHSTPNKEGIPLTKTMVDLQLHPSRHSDNVKKTIEVHTDSAKQKTVESQNNPAKDEQNKETTPDSDNKVDSNEDKIIIIKETVQENKAEAEQTKIYIDKTASKECQDKTVTIMPESKISTEQSQPSLEQSEPSSGKVLEKNEERQYTENLKLECSDQGDVQGLKQPELQHNNKCDKIKSDNLSTLDSHLSIEENTVGRSSSNVPNLFEQNKNQDELESKDFGAQDIKTPKDTTKISKMEVIENKHESISNVNLDPQDNKGDKNKIEVKKPCDKLKKIELEDNKIKNEQNNPSNNKCESVDSKENKDNQQSTDFTKLKNKLFENMEMCKESANNEEKGRQFENVIKEKVDQKCIILDSDNHDIDNKKPESTFVESQPPQSIDLSRDEIISVSEVSVQHPCKIFPVSSQKTEKEHVKEYVVKLTTPSVNVVATHQDIQNIILKMPVTKTEIVPSKSPAQVLTQSTDCKDIKELKTEDTMPDQVEIKTKPEENSPDKKGLTKDNIVIKTKPINNNHAPVPFGKWTDANRQAFLDRFKEPSKLPTNSSNGKQIKNSNDLNRRDVLKKIDSQRQSASIALAKSQELSGINRLGVKKEATAAFSSRPSGIQNSNIPTKTDTPALKSEETVNKNIERKQPSPESSIVTTSKKETVQRKEINNQDLIDKTIDYINRAVPVKTSQEDNYQNISKDIPKSSAPKLSNDEQRPMEYHELEMKMNELHGFPFIERPDNELPRAFNTGLKSLSKTEMQNVTNNKQSKIPNLLPFASKNQPKGVKENIVDVDSEEEIIEHQPITGDMDLTKKIVAKCLASKHEPLVSENITQTKSASKKEAIITEKDFDKFVRRNSINYENCLTVNLDGKKTHNVVQNVVPKDIPLKTYSKNDALRTEIKTHRKLELKQNVPTKPSQTITNFGRSVVNDDESNKNYQSKVKMAYQTAMTVKRQKERPITIIDDKPVKVVFLDSSTEFHPSQLNVQGKELSPPKKTVTSTDMTATGTSDSLDSDILESIYEGKANDETKVKTKHQRKQVLTPVETPELELIEPDELGIDISPKKKRKTEEKVEKSSKALVPKKSYLLGRGITTGETAKPHDLINVLQKDTSTRDDPHSTMISPHKNTASAIDNLVKAAELLETQEGNMVSMSPASDVQNTDSQQSTPIKRGRGRPRKYPLPEGVNEKSKVPSPQKKPRLIDAKVVKNKDSYEDTSSDEELIQENWTMGKINENIVCPICNKLFRSENVVFKHVKHCTGPSPNRSDSDNRSPRRHRISQESESLSHDSKSDDMDIDENVYLHRYARKKRKSIDPSKSVSVKDDVIVIDDTPIKTKPDKKDEKKHQEPKKNLVNKNKTSDKNNSLVCEFCGKTFRQMSYLANHKMQHEKEDAKKEDADSMKTNKTVFSCEVCKKEFRKLHHLVQHRIIHNSSTSAPSKLPRKNSSEVKEDKVHKEQHRIIYNASTSAPSKLPRKNSSEVKEDMPKQNEDLSAGFRCEPCDKSFRKLHHLVEHRETHDGINRQKNGSNIPVQVEKVPPPPQCDICKKTFRKLHHLIEHKEQHLETSSEKSDDKSVKSSLSTRDIIHECSLCYMVFPNEHSLNKHTIICQRKKRQSAAKQLKQAEESDQHNEQTEAGDNIKKDDKDEDDVKLITEEKNANDKPKELATNVVTPIKVEEKTTNITANVENTEQVLRESFETGNSQEKLKHTSNTDLSKPDIKIIKETVDPPVAVKKLEDKKVTKTQESQKKKTPLKDKVAPTVTKRHKPTVAIQDNQDNIKTAESSDDDDIRYMLNPDYKVESELFMQVRANKRNSLQIERPNSKDLVKRRISLQHPPKVPRLKPKPIQAKTPMTQPINTAASSKSIAKTPKLEPVPSTDSDDSDIKYSFPKSSVSKESKGDHDKIPLKDTVKTKQRKSLAEKRKSLSTIAKRKSMGKGVGAKHKVKPSPIKLIKKRTTEVEHRCDCGQLFSSAALLSRHTTLAHTPPRIRKRRSPLPEIITKTIIKPAPRKSSTAAKSRLSADSRKSSVKSDASSSTQKPTNLPSTSRKSSVIKTELNKTPETRKSLKSSDKTDATKNGTSNVKLRRYAAHKGVPVPEKMRKLMEKTKK